MSRRSSKEELLKLLFSEDIQKAGKKATELVQQILTISRQSPHHKEALEVSMVVREAVKLFRATIPDKGTGLGLAVVLSIIEEHQGKIYVYSKPGVGSSFHVYLPIIERIDDQRVSEKEYFEKPIITWEIAKVIRSVIDKRKQPN